MRRLIPTITLLLAAGSGRANAQRSSDEPFRWTGPVEAGRSVFLRNLNGSVRVEQGTGSTLEISARKRWRRGDPDDVEITVRQVGSGRGDVIVCAIWRETTTTCDEDGYRTRSFGWRHRENDTKVEFTVRLPAGVQIDATTVNGDVDIDGATSSVSARTVNGRVDARSAGGPVRASTVNGDVWVRTGVLDDSRTEYSTVNGSITVEIPASANADVEMKTVNGSLSSDFPLTIEGTFSPRRLRATLGRGGPPLRLSTVNGSIRLRKV